jgi:hypothetical protein
MSKIDRGVGYFFFFRLVVFFADFFAAAFVFRFFAIAALLSLSGWRHRCSAVANRRALPSDYYSRKKITVTSLDFVWSDLLPPPQRAHAAIAGAPPRRRSFRRHARAAQTDAIAEVPMILGFYSSLSLRFRDVRERGTRRTCAYSSAQRRRGGRIHHMKIILHRTPSRAC